MRKYVDAVWVGVALRVHDATGVDIMSKIEKNVPLPVSRVKAIEEIENLNKMDIGDSFLWREGAQFNSAYVTIGRIKKSTGKIFTTRTIDGRIRVWRTK